MVRISKSFVFAAAVLCAAAQVTSAQAQPADGATSNWRAGGGPPTNLQNLAQTPNAQRASIARVASGSGQLPNDAGQVWREYDITPYTLRVTSTARPEQAIVDWILRETGYEAWHSDPLGLLSANGRVLRVYHTPQMQEQVAEIVDRFVNSNAETQAFGVRVITLGSPSWRSKAQRVLRPVPVQSQGVQAWLLSKEDCAMLVADLQKRSDFREHSSPHLLVQNGQSTVVAASRPRNYIKDVMIKPEIWPGFQPEAAKIDEGYSLEFKPLLSIDGRSIDAVVKCNIDQVEKLQPVPIDVPTAAAPRQRTEIQVPQMAGNRFAEKFHWPADMVLVVGFGIVPTPTPPEPTAMKIPLISASDHADLLVFVENKGVLGKPPSVTRNLQPAVGVFK